MRFLTLNILLFTFFVLFSLFSLAFAQEINEPEQYVEIRAYAEKTQVVAGEEIWIGIEQQIWPGWHTYWRNPGDSGAEARIIWDVPDGFEVSEIYWPVAKKIPYGPLTNYGYEGKVTLLQKLTIPDKLGADPVSLKGSLKGMSDILVCEEICIPESQNFEIILNSDDAQDNSADIRKALMALPQAFSGDVTANVDNENFTLKLNVQDEVLFGVLAQGDVELLPVEWGLVDNTADAAVGTEKNTIIVSQKYGDRDLSEIENFTAVIGFYDQEGNHRGLEFQGTVSAEEILKTESSDKTEIVQNSDSANSASQNAMNDIESVSLIQAILFAILGGLILNLMPCVFPVLSMKALSLVKLAEKDSHLARMHGLSYTAGIILSFLIIAGALIVLKGAGEQIGWGFQLQNPIVVGFLAYVLFVIGLNLIGAFEFSNRLGGIGQNLTSGQGLSSSFFTGVLATLVATPCTAPFMGTAIAFALTQNAFFSTTVFSALGLGLALPYLALSFLPGLQHLLPKPGSWMDVFKQVLAFPMFASAVWLVWVLSIQSGPAGVLTLLSGFLLIAFAVWLLRLGPGALKRILSILAFLAALLILPFANLSTTENNTVQVKEQKFGDVYSPALLEEKLAGNDPVFIEMTAAWCITCKVNHAMALNIDSTKELFAEKNVQYLIGDWTNKDEEITKFLKSYGRSGVPIYVYYGPRNEDTGERSEAELLPQVLTPGIVREAIEKS